MSDYTLITDGGCKGNPGEMYGSYMLLTSSGKKRVERRGFWQGTNNQAEYLILLAALADLHGVIKRHGSDPHAFSLTVKMDSQLVVKQLNGEWAVNDPALAELKEKAASLLAPFGNVDIQWQRREESVRVLGH